MVGGEDNRRSRGRPNSGMPAIEDAAPRADFGDNRPPDRAQASPSKSRAAFTERPEIRARELPIGRQREARRLSTKCQNADIADAIARSRVDKPLKPAPICAKKGALRTMRA